jgi:leucyl-tRNA synthetase
MEYLFRDIEKKWQEYWAKNKTFRTENNTSRPKYYVLDMFPYPSGTGLHVGHPLGYIASDIVTRYKRLHGLNVLHPMGWDSFGLPAEQYAIQTGQHPAITTEQNIKRYRHQMDRIGFSFDWDRQVKTSDPKFYKWTQWIFLKLFNSWYNPETDKAESITLLMEKFAIQNPKFAMGGAEKNWKDLSEKERSNVLMNYRLAYLSEAWVNWCPALGTVLANDEVKDGVSERGGYPVERKLMPQWSLRITSYAERLLKDLDTIDWSESIKEAQRNWIGRSEGSSLKFSLTPNPSPRERGTAAVQNPGYHTADKNIWFELKEFSKENRQTSTEAEAILWERIRDGKLGHKFRRQHAIGQFIADFVCLEKKLIIEVDGGIHAEQKEYDETRSAMLAKAGYRLIRFTNDEVITKTDWVCDEIKIALTSPSPSERGPGGEANSEAFIEVFTTRPDTVFGATFLTLAPENELVEKITTPEYKKAVDEYVHYAKNRSERERQTDVKKVTGQFTGAYAIHPFTEEKIPIWIGEYVLAGYGTGAVMGVPAHDTRDFAFAKHFEKELTAQLGHTPFVLVTQPNNAEALSFGEGLGEAFSTYDGKCINSDFINGLEVKDAIKKIISEIEKRGLGKGQVNYRMRDAIFGRQRYWGEPIPIYYENGIPKAVDEKDLPVILPEVDKYLPTETGEPPLARVSSTWKYKGKYEYEKTTMPGWAGSSWYYLRYMDPQNDKEFVSKDAVNYWKNVDLYIGGSEHATGHLMYFRFWTKFLYDLGCIPFTEPAQKLINQGMIQGESQKISISGFDLNYQKFNYKRGIKIPINAERHYEIFYDDVFIPLNKIGFAYAVPVVYSPNLALSEYFVKEYGSNTIERNVPVEFVSNNVLNIEGFTKSSYGNDLEFAIFLAEGGYWFRGEFFSFENNKSKDFISKSEVEKMSKSKLNVVNPDDMCDKYGADCFRMYEMFLGPLEQSKPWNTNGITGVFNFLKKLWKLFHTGDAGAPLSFGEGSGGEATKAELKILHKTIKKITEDIERYSFNTCVSTFMICVNELTDLKCSKKEILEPLVVLLSPFAPHIAEELWEKLGHKESVTFACWPQYDKQLTADDTFAYPVSFNGKTRFNIELPLSLTKEEVEERVISSEEAKKFLLGNRPKKVIVVPGRIVNVVV